MCGHAVTAQALVAPPGRRCPCCRDAVYGQRIPHKKARWKDWLRNVFRKGKHAKGDSYRTDGKVSDGTKIDP